MIKSDTLVKLAPALVAAQKKMGAAIKDAKNPFFKSNFADLNSVIEATVPTLNAEGIAVLQTPAMSMFGKPVIQTVLLHESGEFIASETEITAAKVNDPQAAGSAISYARRYGLQATATLRAVDDDGEASMGRSKAEVPKVTKEVIQSVNKDLTYNPTTRSGETSTPETPKKKVSFSRKAVTTSASTESDL